ncbi:MAG: LPS assembly lipoprotein LptE [Pseudomonadales bacterium]
MRSRPRTLWLRWPVALLLVGVLGGCGFHLRTWDLEAEFESAYVKAPSRNTFAEPLRRALRQAGVAEAADPGSAAVVVELLDERRERRSVSVSDKARTAEYEMSMALLFRVLNGAGTELVAPQWVERERVYRVDRDNLVGSSEEQSLLQREMQSDLVQQVVRTLNGVASRVDAPASTGTAGAG